MALPPFQNKTYILQNRVDVYRHRQVQMSIFCMHANFYVTWYFINNNIYIVLGNIPICLAKFEKNSPKCNFYFVTQFMSKRSFHGETEVVYVMVFSHGFLRITTLNRMFSV